jgi:hypothetical protein
VVATDPVWSASPGVAAATAEVLNALNHNNAWFMDVNLVDRTSLSSPLKEEPVGGFPRLPTFGLRFRFR